MSRSRRMVWLLVCATAIATCWPVQSAMARNRLLQRARLAYDNLDYQRVLPLLKRALELESDRDEKIEIYYLMGVMHTIYSRDRQAQKAFVQVLEIDPTHELAADTSPKIREAFEQARQNVARQTSFEATAENGGASVEPTGEVGEVSQSRETVFGHSGLDGLHEQDSGPQLYEQWWIWTLVGAVVLSGATLSWVILNDQQPEHDFGPVPLQ